MATAAGKDWVQDPTLAQPGSPGEQRGVMVDNDDVIANVRIERCQLKKIRQQALEDNDREANKCEEARDKVLEWCANHNPRSSMEARRAQEGPNRCWSAPITDPLSRVRDPKPIPSPPGTTGWLGSSLPDIRRISLEGKGPRT